MLSDVVSAEIRDRFPPAEAEVVRSALESADIALLPEPGRWRDRILVGIIKVADGNLGEFRRALRLAEQDWRDVLCVAGLQHEDWPSVLKRAGYRVP